MKSIINKIGFEIEGEFSEQGHLVADSLGQVKSDGSISSCSSSDRKATNFHLQASQNGAPIVTRAEFNSRPYVLGSYKVKEIFEEFDRLYQNHEFHFNQSCGFHIHMSFKNEEAENKPVELWSVPFNQFFLRRMKKYYPKEYETRKDNTYCRFNPGNGERLNEIIAFSENHYLPINFSSSFNKHGTLEFRMWPASEPAKMREYLDFTTKQVQQFLDNQDEYLKLKEISELTPRPAKVASFEAEAVKEGVINRVQRFREYKLEDYHKALNLKKRELNVENIEEG